MKSQRAFGMDTCTDTLISEVLTAEATVTKLDI